MSMQGTKRQILSINHNFFLLWPLAHGSSVYINVKLCKGLAQLDIDINTTAMFWLNPFSGFQRDVITRKIQDLLTEKIFFLLVHLLDTEGNNPAVSKKICPVDVVTRKCLQTDGQTDAEEKKKHQKSSTELHPEELKIGMLKNFAVIILKLF